MTTQDSSENPRDENIVNETTAEKISAEPVSSQSSTKSAQTAVPRKSGNGGMIALLWLAVLALAAAQFYVWQAGKKSDDAWQMDTAQRLSKLESIGQQQQNLENQYANTQRLMQERLTAMDARIGQIQTERQAMEKLYMQSMPMHDEITMREVEYRVHFAEQQLATNGNVPATLSILQEADHELATLNRADLAEVKAALLQDIEALQRAPVFDARGFLVRLDQALEAIETMAPYDIPTAMPVAPKPEKSEDTPGWKHWWNGVKSTFLSMVRVQIGAPETQGPIVADVALDRQELRLRLLTLRMMVLARQPATRNEAISLSSWLSDHFDNDDPNVAALQTMLSDLVASSVVASPPDISRTVAALRAWRLTQANNAGSY